MAVCYNNLWKLLIDRNMNKTELKEATGVSFNVMARMGKNEPVSFESIEKICIALQCNIGDIMAFSEDMPPAKKEIFYNRAFCWSWRTCSWHRRSGISDFRTDRI